MVVVGLVATTGVAGQVWDKLAIKLLGLFNLPAAGRKNTYIKLILPEEVQPIWQSPNYSPYFLLVEREERLAGK